MEKDAIVVRELTHIDENYVAHGKCKDCDENYSKRKLNKELIFKKFRNLKLGHTDEQFRLLLPKGVYPYEYMTSWEKFDETNLTPKEAFYSNLNESGINDHEYSACIEFGRNLASVTWGSTTISI